MERSSQSGGEIPVKSFNTTRDGYNGSSFLSVSSKHPTGSFSTYTNNSSKISPESQKLPENNDLNNKMSNPFSKKSKNMHSSSGYNSMNKKLQSQGSNTEIKRSADAIRRNSINMEKMIKKNVSGASRQGSLKRGLAVVEYFKNNKKKKHDIPNTQNAMDTTPLDNGNAEDPSNRAIITAEQPQADQEQYIQTNLHANLEPPNTTNSFHDSREIPLPSSAFTSPVRKPRTPLLVRPVHGRGMTSPLLVSKKGALESYSSQMLSPPPRFNSWKSPKFKQSNTTSSVHLLSHRSPGKSTNNSSLRTNAFAASNPQERSTNSDTLITTNTNELCKSPARINSSPRRPSRPPISTSTSSINSDVENSNPVPSSSPVRSLFGPLENTSQVTKPAIVLPAKKKSSPASESLCFSLEGVATSLDVTPDGECIVAGFTDGSVRLFEMDSTVVRDRHGYLLGHIDEESSHCGSSCTLRVKITSDGRFVFVGCRVGPRIVLSIHLDHYRNGKEEDDELEQFQKQFHSHGRLRGFSDVIKTQSTTENSYLLLSGLGVGNLNIWKFIETPSSKSKDRWQYLQTITANGHTATIASFLPTNILPQGYTMGVAAVCEDKNLRVWHINDASTDDEMDDSNRIFKVDVPNTTDIVSIHGEFAYGIAHGEEVYRLSLNSSTAGNNTLQQLQQRILSSRKAFEMEKFDSGSGNTKSRRSCIMLDSVFASESGTAIVASSFEGILYYYSDKSATNDNIFQCIGKHASSHPIFKNIMRVYEPITPACEHANPMIAVVSNPAQEDDESQGFYNVDPIQEVAQRWKKSSNGIECWVCGVRNICHWEREKQPNSTNSNRSMESKDITPMKEKPSKKREDKKEKIRQNESFITNNSHHKASKQKNQTTSFMQSSAIPKNTMVMKSSKYSRDRSNSVERVSTPQSKSSNNKYDKSSPDSNTSEHSSPLYEAANLKQELERYKDRYVKIVNEWKRRLKGERQMRRMWKAREITFNEELDRAMDKVVTLSTQLTEATEALKNADKKFICEKLKHEQHDNVKSRYDELVIEMQEQLAAVDRQKKVLETTTAALVREVDRNTSALKSHAATLASNERHECIICKENAPVVACVPCGHMCFCENDSDQYKQQSRHGNFICPICQTDIYSLLRIYS